MKIIYETDGIKFAYKLIFHPKTKGNKINNVHFLCLLKECINVKKVRKKNRIYNIPQYENNPLKSIPNKNHQKENSPNVETILDNKILIVFIE